VLRLAEANEIAPYVYTGLPGLRRADIPPAVTRQFEQAYDTSRRRNLILREEFVFILKRLREGGIEVIPYKEPLSFSLLCPDIGMRRFKDVDFFVAIEDLPGICKVLESLGYRFERSKQDFLSPGFERRDKDYSFLREVAWTTGEPLPDPQSIDHRKYGWTILEPHWSLAHPRLNVDLPVQDLRSRTRSLSYEGVEVKVLSAEDSLLVACIVGSKSEWRSLKLVTDVASAIESSPQLDWDECHVPAGLRTGHADR
jgi:hypothetical protein